MSSTDFYENMILSIKIAILDKTNVLKEYFDDSRFSNIDYLDELRLDSIDSNITIIHYEKDEMDKELLENLRKKEDYSFILLSEHPIKGFVKHPNVKNVTNVKSLEDKILRIYKDRYKSNTLFLNFSDDITYNITLRKLYHHFEEINLTQRESELLELFLNNLNSLVPHRTIQIKIWHESYDVSDSAYKSLLNKLRSKVGKKTIKSISGKGYTIKL